MSVPDLSARELSNLSGLSFGLVALIESGVRDMGGRSAIALAETLGASIDWLLTGNGDAPLESQVSDAVERARKRAA